MPYGNSGNRWWVGLNVGSDQSTIFGTGSILSPNGYESLPSGNLADDMKFSAAAAYNTLNSAHPSTISVENVKWYNIRGPYATQAQANAAIPAIQRAHPAPGEIAQLISGGQASAATSASGQGGTACLISIPVVGGCLLTKTNVRAMVAGAGLVLFGAVGIVGLLLLVVEGFQRSGAGAAAGSALKTAGAAVAFVPGGQAAGRALGRQRAERSAFSGDDDGGDEV